MADSNQVAFRYIAESTWGTTPASALTNLRITSESWDDTKGVVESAEIISDRQLRDVIEVERGSGGEVSFELSYGTLDPFLEAAYCSAFASDVLENGTTKKSFTFEKQWTDLSSKFQAFKGCRIDTLNLDFSLGQVITGSFSGIGKKGLHAGSSVGTGSASAANTNPVISTIDITGVNEASVDLTGVTGFTMQIQNNLRRQGELGNVDAFGIGYGQFRASGTLTQYFADATLIAKYEGHTESDIDITVTDEDGNLYTFTFPAIKYTVANVPTGGTSQDAVATLNWVAIMDSSTSKTATVTRNPA